MVVDPDFRVGFIMFQDVVRFIAYREAERIDAQNLPLDADEMVTHGAVQNVAYIQPGVTWRPGSFSIAIQLLMAWSEQLVYDRVNTLTPSAPRNSFDEMAASFYGTEASGTLRYTLDFERYRTAGIGIDAGILLPGPAISASAGGDPITKILWRLDLGW